MGAIRKFFRNMINLPYIRPIKERFVMGILRMELASPRYMPCSQTRDDDVFIVGYPKSGNSWFQHMVAALVSGIDPDCLPDTLVKVIVPFYDITRSYLRIYDKRMFFSTHSLPLPNMKNVVLLVRDPRDVMVSYYHHNRAVLGEKFSLEDMVLKGCGLEYGRWSSHVKKWLDNPYGARMLIIKYEDLVADTVEQLKIFCEFANLAVEHGFIEMVAQKNSVENLRKKLMKKEMFYRWPSDVPFVRRGIVGSYRDEMSPHLQESILEEAGGIMRHLGYI